MSTSLMPKTLQPGMVKDFLFEVETASKTRETFDAPAAGPDEARKAVRLSTGPAANGLVGFPAPLALCGPQQFVKFGRQFRDGRDVSILTVPGFVGTEPLPASMDVAIRDLAAAAQRAAGEQPPVLMGYSSGGSFAFGVAAHLAAAGAPAAAVVLLDSYLPGNSPFTAQVEALMLKLLNSPEWRPYLNDTRLTAMGWYTEMLRGWELRPVDVPTLLVRAEQPMSEASGEGDWRPTWPFPHDAVDVVGDHFTMMEDHAAVTAEAVEEWLGATLS